MTGDDTSNLAAMLANGGLLLVGCGKMGGAMLEGWLREGAPGNRICVVEPTPSESLRTLAERSGVTLVSQISGTPADMAVSVVILAVKPQMMADVLPQVAARTAPSAPLALSIAAGTTIAAFEAAFGAQSAVVRAMPNTPAAVGRGAAALTANSHVSPEQRALADVLLRSVGEVVWLEDEALIDAVTAVSGSGPAYVFHMIEALAAAGAAEGLPADLAMTLARATIIGAGELARQSPESAGQLRINVTSPGGTTAAGLEQLMAAEDGLTPLMRRTVAAAARRSRELGG